MVSNDDQLRGVLLGNAVFSLASGATLALAAPMLTQAIAPNLPWPLLAALGVGVALFGLINIGLTRMAKLPRGLVWLVFWGDVAWVAASALEVAFLGQHITGLGVVLIEMVALMTAGFAVLEFIGLTNSRGARTSPAHTPTSTAGFS